MMRSDSILPLLVVIVVGASIGALYGYLLALLTDNESARIALGILGGIVIAVFAVLLHERWISRLRTKEYWRKKAGGGS